MLTILWLSLKKIFLLKAKQMKKIIVVSSVLLLTIIVLAYLYFSNISASNRNIDKSLAVIPYDASAIFEFTNDKAFYEIFSGYKLFDAIIGQQVQTEISYLKSIVNSNNLKKLSDGQTILLSFHPEKDSIAFLWTMPLKFEFSLLELQNQLRFEKRVSTIFTNINDSKVLIVTFKAINKSFYIYTDKNVAIASYSKAVLEKSLDKNQKKISNDFAEIINILDIKNQQSPANIFLNYTTIQSFIEHYFIGNSNSKFILLNHLKGFASLNLSFRSDALIFNGISTIDTSNSSYLKLFLHQQPITQTINRILPNNTSYFIEYGLSDYNLFKENLNKQLNRNELENIKHKLTLIKTKTGVDLDKDVRTLWGNEFITFQLASLEKLAAIQVSNGQKLQFYFEPLSTFYSDNIRLFDNPDLLHYYFGDPLKTFSKPYFTIIDNHLIVANSPSTLQRFIKNYNNGQLLYKYLDYKAFSNMISDKSNITLFINFPNSRNYIKNYLSPNISKAFRSKNHGLKDFYGVCYQLESNNTQFLTNFYAGYKQEILNDSLLISGK